MLEVLRAGPLATVQDAGRPGYAHLGVPRSGALDLPALALANRLVGNEIGVAGLELSLGRFAASFHTDARIAVTGATATVTLDGVVVGTPADVHAGQRLEIGPPTIGVHCYLAVQGGIDVPMVLGSRSTDTLSGLGPPPLRPGTRLPFARPTAAIGPAVRHGEAADSAGSDAVVVRVRFGPRDYWFRDPTQLLQGVYTMRSANRIGARLAGPALTRAVEGELASEGLVTGAIQVPGDGQPIVFLADHPTTGGYPVIAVVHPVDIPLIAQARPGARVVFRGP